MILHVEDRFSRDKISLMIHTWEDFYDLLMHYPDIRPIIYSARTVNEAIENVGKYLASRNLNVSLEGENVFERSKVISKALTILGLTATLTAPSCMHKSDPLKYRPFGYSKEDRFLQNIMMLESSGGLNQNHSDPDTVGKWGMRLPTIKDTIRRFDSQNADLIPLASMQVDQIKSLFKKNPAIELHLARLLARHVLSTQRDDEHRAAFCWRYGHNLRSDHITDEKLANDYYVNRYKHFDAQQAIKKAESDMPFGLKMKSWLEKRRTPKQIVESDVGTDNIVEATKEPVGLKGIKQAIARAHENK